METLKAPFPYFGGKSRVAHIIWSHFGNVANYVEPFAGSLAVLLARPDAPTRETVNDFDCYLANFWRAVKMDPDAVAKYADYPVSEADLIATNNTLVRERAEFSERFRADIDFYDARTAGWWVWGISQWIGAGFCDKKVGKKLPHLGSGQGIHALGYRYGNSILENIQTRFRKLHDRLRNVQVMCGDWTQAIAGALTFGHGITGVMLDPPYSAKEHTVKYAGDTGDIAGDVCRWAVENGNNPLLRIALCGYEGEHQFPDDWECFAWKASGGYANQGQGKGRENARRERIWFSPACLRPGKAIAGETGKEKRRRPVEV
jgi:DNA adenine methylase